MQTSEQRGGAARLLGLGLMALMSTTAAGQDIETYVRAKEGAQVRVFQDANAKSVGTMAAGDLLRVHQSDVFDLPDGRRLAWHEVSSPKGFPVWVFGQYLTATGAKDVYAVTGNAVKMRPMPESSIASYPLRTTLRAGDRVLMMERSDATLPLESDWVRVWSPSTAKAWINAADTTAVKDTSAARLAFSQDLRVLPSAPVKSGADVARPVEGTSDKTAGTQAASVTGPRVPDEAYRSLNYGNTLLDNALKKGKSATEADFQPAIRAYNVVLDMAPAGSQVAGTATNQLERATMLQKLAALRDDLSTNERQNEATLRKLQQEQYEDQMKGLSNMGRFVGRGWVEKVTKGKEVRWYLRWAGDVVYEIECGSGRYDLKHFNGYQIGVIGTTVRNATPSTDTVVRQVSKLDVSRIEVIDGGRQL